MKKIFEKNTSAVILNPERSEWVSRSHVTGVEIVVNDGAKTKPHHALRRSLRALAYGSTLKMTDNSLSLSGASSEKQKESSLVQRKSERQAIFKFTLSSASGGAGGGKYNRISAFVSMSVLLIRRSLEFFRVPRKNRDDRFCFGFAKVLVLALLFTLATTAESKAQIEEACDCGKNCCYQLENGVLNFYRKDDTQDAQIKKVFWFKGLTDIIIPEGFSAVGDGIFANGVQAHIPENATNLNKLKSVSIPSSLKKAGYMLYYLTYLKEIIIPDDIDFSDWRYDTFYQSTSNLTVVCQGDIEICKQKVNDSNIFPQSKKFLSADRNRCNNPNYYWSGSECTKRPTDGTDILCDYEYSGYIKIGNNCYSPEETYAKKHYTPAEANQWLHDGNDNFVVITFKK